MNSKSVKIEKSLNFLIVSSGFNCGRYVNICFDSLQSQTYKNFDAVLISDGSQDGTAQRLSSINGRNSRIICESFRDNLGAAKRRFDAIHKYAQDDETVVLLLGLDDRLMPNALERINQEYENGKWMTYGNWTNQFGIGLPDDFELEFDDMTHFHRNYRKVKYRSTAPNTFKKFLFDEFKEDEFKMKNGKWFDTTTESHLMFSCLEMCGKEKIGIIKEPIYTYNQNLREGTLRRLGARYKRDVLEEVMERPKKDKLERNESRSRTLE